MLKCLAVTSGLRHKNRYWNHQQTARSVDVDKQTPTLEKQLAGQGLGGGHSRGRTSPLYKKDSLTVEVKQV